MLESVVRYFAKKLCEASRTCHEHLQTVHECSQTFVNNLRMFVCTLLRDKFSTPCVNKTLHNTVWQTYMLHDCCKVLLACEPVAFVRTYVHTSRIFNKPAKQQLEVITHKAVCPISSFTLLNIQCTSSENGTPIQLLLLG